MATFMIAWVADAIDDAVPGPLTDLRPSQPPGLELIPGQPSCDYLTAWTLMFSWRETVARQASALAGERRGTAPT